MHRNISGHRAALAVLIAVSAGLLSMQAVSVSAASDTRAPSSKITSPAKGATIPASLVNYSIKGTSKDNRGGSGVAYVEVSTDGGSYWGRATDRSGNGTWSKWSYRWPLDFLGTYTLKSRARDKAGNLENSTRSVTVTVTH